MTTKDAIKANLALSRQILTLFMADLSDADLLVRPVPSANCIAWQLGHVITSEAGLGAMIPGSTPAELPAGFADRHKSDAAKADPATAGFHTKAEYLAVFDKVRAHTLALVDAVHEADLDMPTTGRITAIAPTVGHVLVLLGAHLAMHAGQFSVVRRLLGKPVAF